LFDQKNRPELFYLAKIVAKSSSYEGNPAQSHLPLFALPNASSSMNFFRSVRELNPWIVFDYNLPRNFTKVNN